MRVFQSFRVNDGILQFLSVDIKPVCQKILDVTNKHFQQKPQEYREIKAVINKKNNEDPIKIRILGPWNSLENSKSIISILDQHFDTITYLVDGRIKEEQFYDFLIDKTARKVTILVVTLLDDDENFQINCYGIKIEKSNWVNNFVKIIQTGFK